MVFHIHLEAVVSGEEARLLGHAAVVGVGFASVVIGTRGCALADGDRAADVLLAAAVNGAVLYAFDVEVSGGEGDAFAADLCAFQGGVAAALDHGMAVGIADAAVAVGHVVAVAVTFAVVAAAGKAEGETVLAVADGNAGIPAAAAVVAAFTVVLFGRLQHDVLGAQQGTFFTGHVGAGDVQTAFVGHQADLAAADDLAALGGAAFSMALVVGCFVAQVGGGEIIKCRLKN